VATFVVDVTLMLLTAIAAGTQAHSQFISRRVIIGVRIVTMSVGSTSLLLCLVASVRAFSDDLTIAAI
jgi:hypothetical protein